MYTLVACSQRPTAGKVGDTLPEQQETSRLAPRRLLLRSIVLQETEGLLTCLAHCCSLRLLFGRTLDKALKIIDNPGPEGPPVLCFTARSSLRRLFVVSWCSA